MVIISPPFLRNPCRQQSLAAVLFPHGADWCLRRPVSQRIKWYKVNKNGDRTKSAANFYTRAKWRTTRRRRTRGKMMRVPGVRDPLNQHSSHGSIIHNDACPGDQHARDSKLVLMIVRSVKMTPATRIFHGPRCWCEVYYRNTSFDTCVVDQNQLSIPDSGIIRFFTLEIGVIFRGQV